MKYEGEITGLDGDGIDTKVRLQNVRLKSAAGWREYSPSVTFTMPEGRGRAFILGRRVRITVEPLA